MAGFFPCVKSSFLIPLLLCDALHDHGLLLCNEMITPFLSPLFLLFVEIGKNEVPLGSLGA